jgi:hypothetical protein
MTKKDSKEIKSLKRYIDNNIRKPIIALAILIIIGILLSLINLSGILTLDHECTCTTILDDKTNITITNNFAKDCENNGGKFKYYENQFGTSADCFFYKNANTIGYGKLNIFCTSHEGKESFIMDAKKGLLSYNCELDQLRGD